MTSQVWKAAATKIKDNSAIDLFAVTSDEAVLADLNLPQPKTYIQTQRNLDSCRSRAAKWNHRDLAFGCFKLHSTENGLKLNKIIIRIKNPPSSAPNKIYCAVPGRTIPIWEIIASE